MMKSLKSKKGISLIVLIITIAVILILSAAIILSVSTNRPIETAQQATSQHNESVLKESAAVLSNQWKVDKILDETSQTREDYVKQGLRDQGFTEDEIARVSVDETTGSITIN